MYDAHLNELSEILGEHAHVLHRLVPLTDAMSGALIRSTSAVDELIAAVPAGEQRQRTVRTLLTHDEILDEVHLLNHLDDPDERAAWATARIRQAVGLGDSTALAALIGMGGDVVALERVSRPLVGTALRNIASLPGYYEGPSLDELEMQQQREWADDEQWRVLDLLIDHRADPNGGRTGSVLHGLIARDGLTATILDRLMRAGGDLERAMNGRSPLDYAAMVGKTKTVRLLLSVGADPHRPDDLIGRTAFLNALDRGNPSIVRAFVEAGAARGPGLDAVRFYHQTLHMRGPNTKRTAKILTLLKPALDELNTGLAQG
ncbi:Ankyrin repeat-containing protein [Paraburkholderia phenazinium]|uniref:Ankyrin repeat-containing protein n=1 Tax=Paraburkholderia phenazinium TaxID=60549 RepID=A0A1G7YE28_9BURK|nr:ankyrin repeat domain-containing protein [Paraburkholderia phenazinium]SDG94802.1 Ankyrin repeat-containing protein [Paraburkholderia phenazinium]